MATYSQPHPNIKIYDNVLSKDNHELMHKTCLQAPYEIGWGDTIENQQTHFHSVIDTSVWNSVRDGSAFYSKNILKPPYNIIDILARTEACKQLKDLYVRQTVINLDTIADTHAAHNHKNQTVALFYLNPFWKPSWGGETLFFDSITDEVILAVPYTPNRMIVFDGNIDHSFNGPNVESQLKNRISISTFFSKEKQQNEDEFELAMSETMLKVVSDLRDLRTAWNI